MTAPRTSEEGPGASHGPEETPKQDAADGPAALSGATSRERLLALAGYSFLTLFAEVVFIRWLSAETRFFGFYKNMALLSCFVGLGTGATLGGQGKWRRWFVPALSLFVVAVMLAAPRLVSLHPDSGDEFVWLPRGGNLGSALFYGVFVLLFAANTAVFFAGGQAVGAAFEGLPPLRAYTVNLLASFAGTVMFAAMSYLRWGPMAWFGVVLVLGTLMTWKDRPVRLATAISGALLLMLVGLLGQGSVWSPYYKITAQPYLAPDGAPWGWLVRTNSTYHLTALDLSDGFLAAHPSARDSYPPGYYNLPYRHIQAERVLVLGAGAGNDVAAALRHGATSVTAVEIDPEIARLGRQLHPEHPYDSPRVQLVVDDARAFLQRATGPYDLIVYGLLDSHTVLAAMSNVRLDNFMYTRESLERARALLSPRGMIALSFSSGFGESFWIHRRIAMMLERTFGRPPLILDVGYDRGVVFLAGPGAPTTLQDPADQERLELARRKLVTGAPPGEGEELTDDWPFMYLKARRIPREYWVMGGAVVLLAVLMIRRLVPGGLRAVDGHFFFLGAGFLLLEVRNLAELALLFGSTWVVNTFVIAGVLAMALLANLVAAVWSPPRRWAFALLALAVALSFLSPVKYLAGTSDWVKALAGTGLLSLPFFFSGLVFSSSFKGARSLAVAYGSNLLGAVVGGLVEHASMALGIRSLSAFALVLYLLAYVTLARVTPAARRA